MSLFEQEKPFAKLRDFVPHVANKKEWDNRRRQWSHFAYIINETLNDGKGQVSDMRLDGKIVGRSIPLCEANVPYTIGDETKFTRPTIRLYPGKRQIFYNQELLGEKFFSEVKNVFRKENTVVIYATTEEDEIPSFGMTILSKDGKIEFTPIEDTSTKLTQAKRYLKEFAYAVIARVLPNNP